MLTVTLPLTLTAAWAPTQAAGRLLAAWAPTLAANIVAKPAWAPTMAANTVAKPARATTPTANTVAKPTWALKRFVMKIYGKLNGVESLRITRLFRIHARIDVL